MNRTRRSFLRHTTALGASLATRALAQQMSMPMPLSAATADPAAPLKLPPMLHSAQLTPFVDPLPRPQPARANAHGRLVLTMREIHAKVHRDVPPTRMWSYGDTALGPLLEARSGQPLQVEWVNRLPSRHFLPIDYSLHGCGHDVPEVRACVHLHGGKTPSASDGYPEDWYVPGQSRTSHYPLQQDAATLWYHDHAMGINRLNIYAGLFGLAIVRSAEEEALGLPSGSFEVPIALCDRLFTAEGQLFYPTSGKPDHPWVSEFEGDAILLNGKVRPYLHVEPRPYRFRLLNAANSRFFELSLTGNLAFQQIGTDQGLLAAPVPLKHLLLAPAERADLLLDFSALAGQTVYLVNGVVPVLELRVAPAAAKSRPQTVPAKLRTIDRIPPTEATVTRRITLDEAVDHVGNSMLMYLDKKRWHEPTTEFPRLGSTEIWEFVNLTADTHPLHLHLVRFQILDRRRFDVFAYRNNQGMHYLAGDVPLEPNELGWKDVVQCPPELTTRIIVRFDGYSGKYLYHCHILEHEALDMMRPYEVVA